MSSVAFYSPFLHSTSLHLKTLEKMEEKIEEENLEWKEQKIKSIYFNEEENNNNSLRTSHDVYYRLLWNPPTPLSHSDLFIGYLDRFEGMIEIPFNFFDPKNFEEEIPFHRIHYFRAGAPSILLETINLSEENKPYYRGKRIYLNNNTRFTNGTDSHPDGSIVLWDRESRIDLIFGSGNTEKIFADEQKRKEEKKKKMKKKKKLN